jgi:hypothetical protein
MVVMEELCPMCDRGRLLGCPTSEIDGRGAQHIGGCSPHPTG